MIQDCVVAGGNLSTTRQMVAQNHIQAASEFCDTEIKIIDSYFAVLRMEHNNARDGVNEAGRWDTTLQRFHQSNHLCCKYYLEEMKREGIWVTKDYLSWGQDNLTTSHKYGLRGGKTKSPKIMNQGSGAA